MAEDSQGGFGVIHGMPIDSRGAIGMSAKMTERDWEIALEALRASLPGGARRASTT